MATYIHYYLLCADLLSRSYELVIFVDATHTNLFVFIEIQLVAFLML